MSSLPLILFLLFVLNLWTVLSFKRDKRAAVAGGPRTPEAWLLGLALIGGTPGAFLGRRLFRHKTRKQPFTTMLKLIALAQLAGAGLAGWLFL